MLIVLSGGSCFIAATCHADSSDTLLIPAHSVWKYDTADPQAKSIEWTHLMFDDSGWPSGLAGIGYGDNDDRTELNDMRGNFQAIKARHVFTITNTDVTDKLHLYIRYDDGFVAYINGQEVVRANVFLEGKRWVAEDHEADEFEHFVIKNAAELLASGDNVLAIVGVNRSDSSSDFSLDPVLALSRVNNPGIRPLLTKAQYLADLNSFASRLEDQSSYLTLTDFDFRRELSTLQDNAIQTTRTKQLARQLRRVIANIGDAHADVSTEFYDGSSRYLPFILADTDVGVIAIEGDGEELLDVDHPYVAELDGIALDRWLDTANQYIVKSSEQLRRRRGLSELRWISELRSDLELPATEEIEITLRSADWNDQVSYNYLTSDERLPSGKVPLVDSRLLENNIGYLRISSMSNSRLEKVLEDLENLLATDGLIIDVRDNSGGRYGILQSIYGHFLPANADPYVSNIGAYRLSARFDEDHLYYRPTFPLNHAEWNAQQLQSIQSAMQRFKPQWLFPPEKFSDWHFMLLGKQTGNKDIHYSKPVVVLSNAGSFSATDGFLSAFSDLEQVTIMGTPSAGGSGATRRFELPHSGIEIALSSMASYRPDGSLYDGKGVEVDVLATPTILDYLGNTDTVLEKAISLLLSKR